MQHGRRVGDRRAPARERVPGAAAGRREPRGERVQVQHGVLCGARGVCDVPGGREPCLAVSAGTLLCLTLQCAGDWRGGWGR